MGITENRLKELQKILTPEAIAKEAFGAWYKNTPIRSGNARRHTDLRGNIIEANYPYAVRLDHGWSKQSPKGMLEPTMVAVRAYIKKYIG